MQRVAGEILPNIYTGTSKKILHEMVKVQCVSRTTRNEWNFTPAGSDNYYITVLTKT